MTDQRFLSTSDDMKTLGSLFLLLIVLAVSGCTAQEKVPTVPEYTQAAPESTQKAPEYTHETPIPLKVGIILDDSPISSSYGLVVVKEWEEMKLFDSLVYPYQEGDLVDVVLRLSITSGGEEVIGDTEEVVEDERNGETGRKVGYLALRLLGTIAFARLGAVPPPLI